MSRNAMQHESFHQLEWVLEYSQLDLHALKKPELRRLGFELATFVRKAAVRSDLVPEFYDEKKWLPVIQAGLKKHLDQLATAYPVKAVSRKTIKDSTLSSTSVPVSGEIDVISLEGLPYRQIVRANSVPTQVYTALASHIVASGVVGGQIRRCPQCSRLFLLKIKPQPNRDFHCSTRCTNQATFRRYRERQLRGKKRAE